MKAQSLSRKLAAFVNKLSFEQLPPEVVERAKNLILDGLGTEIAGLGSPYERPGMALVKSNRGSSTVLGKARRVPAVDAAFVNSLSSAYIGQSDDLWRGHPGDVVLPAAIAVGEQEGSSGAEVITALVAGYDIFGRVAMAGLAMLPRFRVTPVVGPLGAATAAGKLLGLDEDRLTYALGYAANFASGFPECYGAGTMEGRFQGAMASRSGITAAVLAWGGAQSCETALDGEAGFYKAFAGTNQGLDAATADLGKRFFIMETIYKPFPCCASLQVSVGLALDLARKYQVKGSEIDSITEILPNNVYTFPGINYVGAITTPIQAKMSGRFCTGSALLGKPIASFSYFDKSYNDPEVARLATRINLIGEKERDNTRMTRIDVTLKSGEHRTIEAGMGEVLFPTARNIRPKFEALTTGFLGKEKVNRVMDIVANLDKAKNIRLLTRELGGAAKG